MEILRLLVFLTLLPSVFVLLGAISGRISFNEAYPIFIDLVFTDSRMAGSQTWRMALGRTYPTDHQFFLGSHMVYLQGLGNNATVLMFSTSVILAGMLQGSSYKYPVCFYLNNCILPDHLSNNSGNIPEFCLCRNYCFYLSSGISFIPMVFLFPSTGTYSSTVRCQSRIGR